MKKLLLLVLLGLISCSEQEEEYCNSSCWTVINKKQKQLSNNTVQFSIKILRNCTDNDWTRVYLNNSTEYSMYDVGDSLCGEQVPQ